MLQKLKKALRKSRDNLTNQFSQAFNLFKTLEPSLWERVEEILIQADVGVETSLDIVTALKEKTKRKRIKDSKLLPALLREELEERLLKLYQEKGDAGYFGKTPQIFLVFGVNGTGKTTTIAKIANYAQSQNKKVLLAAADTFRAAAIEQLEIWGKRIGADVIRQERGSDPAAVVYDAIQAANARKMDLLLVDTAGRLHTHTNLMEELKKIKRVVLRESENFELRSLLIIDATTGQNALAQASLFNQTLGVDEIILTKLDGTAKGGMVLAIENRLGIPVTMLGLGEKLEDLHEFAPHQFVEALLSSS